MENKLEKSLKEFKIDFDRKIINFFDFKINNLENIELKEVYSYIKDYVLAGGKRLRPYILYKMNIDFINIKNIDNIFLAFEFLHNSTLIDDDIIDEHNIRRNKPTIPEIYKNNKNYKGNYMALLCANLLKNEGLNLIVNSKLPKNLKDNLIFAYLDISKNIDSAQILDLKYRGRFDINEKEYINQSKKVTAKFISYMFSLFVTKKHKSNFLKIGEYLGIAFQLTDDLLDIDQKKQKGRSLGSDIKEGTQTLLTIYAFKKLNQKNNKKYKSLFNKKDLLKEDLEWIILKYKENYIISDVNKKISFYINKINNLIKEIKNPSTKEFIIEMSKYCLNRLN